MNKNIKRACLIAAASLLPLSQAATAGEVKISGWINEGVMFYDDGVSSDIVQGADNGTTLNTRLSFQGVQELGSLSAGFEITLEPNATFKSGLFGGVTPLGTATQATYGDDNAFNSDIGLLANNIWMKGGLGKVTIGTQSMPTDNMAVLADKSLTLWTGVAPMFRGNNFTISGLTGTAAGQTWGTFLQCLTTPALGIGFDCNGIYRNGVRYDTPTFGPFRMAAGWANDDIYDIAAWYDGTLGGLNVSLHGGFAKNFGPTLPVGLLSATAGVLGQGVAALDLAGGGVNYQEAEVFQMQLGVMDPGTGIFGSFSYQYEEAEGFAAGDPNAGADDNDAYYFKVGIKRDFNSLGPTAFTFDYGSHNDYFNGAAGTAAAPTGVTGSEIERFGFGINQYFGAGFILYGKYEQLDLNIDCSTAACSAAYAGADELDTFNLGAVLFF